MWMRPTTLLPLLFALLLGIPPDSAVAIEEEEFVSARSLTGEDVPPALCVQAFLVKSDAAVVTREDTRLRDSSGADDQEWSAVHDARVEAQRLYAGITADHKRYLGEVEHLREVDHEEYWAVREEADLRWRRNRMDALARVYAGLLDKLDVTTEVAIAEYVRPGTCAGHVISYNTTEKELDPEGLAIYASFETLVEEYRQ